MKICIVLTSRGNYAKFKKLIQLCREDSEIDLSVVVGGELVLKDRVSKFEIDYDMEVYFSVGGDNTISMAKSTGAAISEFSSCFNILNPDIVMVVGDRFETLGVVTAAYMNNIPVAHLEGGELSGSMDEGLRHAITKMSHLHFVCTEKAGRIVQQLGEYNIHVVGSTSLDSLDDLASPEDMMALQEKTGSGAIIDVTNPFIVVCQHSVTNETETNIQIFNTILAIDSLAIPTFWVNANLDAGNDIIGSALRRYHDNGNPNHVRFFKSLPIMEYGYLLKNAFCVIGNSSAGIRECSFLGTPNVNIGSRQNGRERGDNTVDVGHRGYDILNAIEFHKKRGRCKPSYLYGDGKASRKILEIVKTYKADVQKVFYDMGNHTCEGGKCRDKEQEHSDVGGETTVSVGAGYGVGGGGVQQDCSQYRYFYNPKPSVTLTG